MIIKAKIEWSQEKSLDPIEKEQIEARAEFETSYDPYDDLNEKVEKDAIIDTNEDKIYVQVSDDSVCIMQLLGGDYIITDKGVQKFQERVIIKTTLKEIEKNINKQKNL